MSGPYPLLSSSIKVGQVELANRLVMAPIDTQYATEEGYVTERLLNFYRRRTGRGMSLMISENTGVDRGGKSNIRMLGLFDDSYIEGIRKFVDAVHEGGTRIIIQLNHAGRQTNSHFLGGGHPVAASDIPCPLVRVTPHELTVDQINSLQHKFAEAAERACEAGADGIELHMAHGYLLCGFLSPFSNARTDQFGGSLERRLSFPLQVLSLIRKKIPSPFIIGCRISGDEQVEGGLTLKETVPVTKSLENAGADYIHVSCCNNASGHKNIPSYYEPMGVFVEFAEAIKQTVNIPVISVGRIHDLDLAEKILAGKKADMTAIARPFVADPDFGLKIEKPASLKGPNCLSCNRCIASLVKTTDGIACTVNPFIGEDEFEDSVQPAETVKNILVVGGGPGGMLAAYRSAKRGHRVTLWEKEDRLGGALGR